MATPSLARTGRRRSPTTGAPWTAGIASGGASVTRPCAGSVAGCAAAAVEVGKASRRKAERRARVAAGTGCLFCAVAPRERGLACLPCARRLWAVRYYAEARQVKTEWVAVFEGRLGWFGIGDLSTWTPEAWATLMEFLGC